MVYGILITLVCLCIIFLILKIIYAIKNGKTEYRIVKIDVVYIVSEVFILDNEVKCIEKFTNIFDDNLDDLKKTIKENHSEYQEVLDRPIVIEEHGGEIYEICYEEEK